MAFVEEDQLNMATSAWEQPGPNCAAVGNGVGPIPRVIARTAPEIKG
jgi:hypothetical protein